jgi:hypothetical protein
MLIVIPTSGRSDPKKQVTLRNFIDMKSQREIVLCIPRNERISHVNKIRDIRDRHPKLKLTVEYVPDEYYGISHTRKWIMTEYAASREERHILMLDDDMDFCYRPDMRDPTLETIKDPIRFEAMFQMLEQWLAEGFVHIGIAARQGSNHFLGPEGYRDVGRMMNAYAYDTIALKEIGIEFGRIPVMEDFDLTLQLLRKGYPNRVSYQYVWNQRGSGAEGGCSKYRTAEMQTQAAELLQQYHPNFVTLVTKETGSVWKDMEERSDVNVQWQRAYEEGKQYVRDRSAECT